MMEQLQAVLNAGTTVGDFCEVIFAQCLLIGKAERTMIC